MAGKKSFVSRFMHATGKARAVFGPAQSSPIDHEMSEENKVSLESQTAKHDRDWVTIMRPDGGTYIAERKK